MAVWNIYKSTDASAPVLTGQTGSLTALLTAILTTGYGALPNAGWTLSFSATSKAVYRQGGGNQFYLNIDDSGPGTATFQEARASGIEAATGVGTGTGIFPTTAQQNIGIGAVVIRKSAAASGTARAWWAAADNKTLILFIASGDTGGTYTGFYFGDILSVLTGDNYRTVIVGRTSENSGVMNTSVEAAGVLNASNLSAATAGHFVARSYPGTGGSATLTALNPGAPAGASTGFTGTLEYPNGPDQSIYIGQIPIAETGIAAIRGYLRGLYTCSQPAASFADQDTISGAGAFAGKSFQVVKSSGGTAAGAYVVEISDTVASSS